ncbi:hypothetical protein [Mangrovibacillus cuniculi]|uniref:Competence protein n=1 Tax=Mangrovibacillus cuniculi TaxID=2593652 RepID=A0A7S8C9W2_9BACI|nr:hypothetical protein [Mangrovibacillus cuniculi]QPC46053.1 hypothetical protein G8O30_03305 [Mangrovibacillus cuniculi]
MGKGKGSRRFSIDSKNAVQLHDQKFPYHMTYAEAEAMKLSSNANSIENLGGGN